MSLSDSVRVSVECCVCVEFVIRAASTKDKEERDLSCSVGCGEKTNTTTALID